MVGGKETSVPDGGQDGCQRYAPDCTGLVWAAAYLITGSTQGGYNWWNWDPAQWRNHLPGEISYPISASDIAPGDIWWLPGEHVRMIYWIPEWQTGPSRPKTVWCIEDAGNPTSKVVTRSYDYDEETPEYQPRRLLETAP